MMENERDEMYVNACERGCVCVCVMERERIHLVPRRSVISRNEFSVKPNHPTSDLSNQGGGDKMCPNCFGQSDLKSIIAEKCTNE